MKINIINKLGSTYFREFIFVNFFFNIKFTKVNSFILDFFPDLRIFWI